MERNPAPVLFPRSNLSSDSDFEWKQHLWKRPAVSAQHNSNPKMHHPDALSCCRIRCSFPLTADIGKESRPRSAVFAKYRASAIAIVPNGRSADHNLRWFLQLRERFRNQLCTSDPAVSNPKLLSSCPPAGSNVLTCKVNQRVDAGKRCLVNRSFLRIPSRRTSDGNYFMATACQQRNKGRADEPRGAGNSDLHLWRLYVGEQRRRPMAFDF